VEAPDRRDELKCVSVVQGFGEDHLQMVPEDGGHHPDKRYIGEAFPSTFGGGGG